MNTEREKERNQKMTIYFDMDGTIADLYGVENWLNDLINSNTRPYDEAKPLINFSALARQIHKMQKIGFTFGIVSWLSKSGTEEYNKAVTESKMNWLKKHLPSVIWDEIHIVSYGTPKSTIVNDKNGFLFDDELNNRIEWGKNSFGVENILATLRTF
ncbi:MAG: hypothetical protein J6I85_06075 [Clostridia bacterium]|nr:hypothetical protein [Clostridia bacterium]